MAPLNIVIVGAGIAGLTAALALRQQGHKCTLLEKSKFNQESGAAINVGANVSGLLRDLGYDAYSHGGNDCNGMIRYASDGSVIFDLDLGPITKDWKEKWLLCHRVDLHTGLKDAALDPKINGPVPELVLGCNITKVDSAAGTVELDDGRKFTGDVIVGADGNRSMTRLEIKPDAQLIPYGKSFYRWLIPMEDIRNDPELSPLFKDSYYGEFWAVDRKIVFYPCRKDTLLNVAATAFDSEREAEPSLSNKQFMQKAYGSWFSGVKKLFETADEDLKAWKLWDLDVMPHWHKDKLVLIGDAAHPYLPFMGQGGAMGIEDAVCISKVLSAGLSASEVPERLKLYQDIRSERATFMQYASRVNDWKEKPKDFDFNKAIFGAHNYDEAENTDQKIKEWLGKREGKPVNGA